MIWLKHIHCHVKTNLFDNRCLDWYGSQLWNYGSIEYLIYSGSNHIEAFGSYTTQLTTINWVQLYIITSGVLYILQVYVNGI